MRQEQIGAILETGPQGVPLADFGTRYPVLAFCREKAF